MERCDLLTRVSVVVSTHGRERANGVLDCIKSLRCQTFLPDEVFLVCDDEDSRLFYSSQVAKEIITLLSEAVGLATARNAGVRNAKGDVVAFIDDDATADKDWLKNLVMNYDEPAVFGVGGLIRAAWDSGPPRWFPEELDWVVGCSYRGLPDHRGLIRNPIGCNMSFRRQAFDRVGYFKLKSRADRSLLGSEETEFSIRLLRNIPESKIIYEPSAITYHRVPRNRQTLRYLLKRSFSEGFSKRMVEKLQRGSLSVEGEYLRYLLTVSVPSRLKRIYEVQSILQLAVLGLSVSLVLAGYLVGGLREFSSI